MESWGGSLQYSATEQPDAEPVSVAVCASSCSDATRQCFRGEAKGELVNVFVVSGMSKNFTEPEYK